MSRVIQLHKFFLCFVNSLHSHWDYHKTLVPGLHLFQTFVGVCDAKTSGTIYTLCFTENEKQIS